MSGLNENLRFLRGLLTEAEPESAASADPVLPAEELMREHGVLRRNVVVLGEAVRKMEAGDDVDPAIVHDSADIIRRFIGESHQKNEEEFIFPLFTRDQKFTELTETLKKQHRAGDWLIGQILELTKNGLETEGSRRKLILYVKDFNRMASAHGAVEDTVLFPALRKIVTPDEYAAIGHALEAKEQERFGGNGFEITLAETEGVEKRLGISDLSKFTSR